MRRLLPTSRFKRDFRHQPELLRRQTDEAIRRLLQNPLDPNLDIQKLAGHKGVWRVRLGVYRLLYSFDDACLTLLRFRHRKDVYQHLDL